MVRYETVRYGAVGMLQYGTVRRAVRCVTARHDMVRCVALRHGTIWCGAVRCVSGYWIRKPKGVVRATLAKIEPSVARDAVFVEFVSYP